MGFAGIVDRWTRCSDTVRKTVKTNTDAGFQIASRAGEIKTKEAAPSHKPLLRGSTGSPWQLRMAKPQDKKNPPFMPHSSFATGIG
jgi:hypothetical protein